MLYRISAAALAAFAGIAFPTMSNAACADHTFDACPPQQPSYAIEVDSKTGRTWLREAARTTSDTSTLARLSATARNVPPGALAKAEGDAKGADDAGAATAWRTQVARAKDGIKPLK